MALEALNLRRIDAYYGDSHVLQRVSFGAGAGRLLGLVGRNGAGKTTAMNVAVGLLPPRSGTVEVFGTDVSGSAPEQIAACGVALVPQGRRVFRSLTVRENLSVAARKPIVPGKTTWDLDTVFAMFPRLAERRHQLASVLSGGEQQMLAIGRALMGNPRLLLMDEPSEGLAPANRRRRRAHHRQTQGRRSVDRVGGAEHQAHLGPGRRYRHLELRPRRLQRPGA